MTDTSSHAAKEEFELHVAHITEVHKSFIDSTAKVAGFLLLALGWYVTSNDARAFFATNQSVTMIAATAVVSAYLLSVRASWVGYQVSGKAFRRLNELQYLPLSAYEGRVLRTTTFAACIAGNGVLSVLLIIALLSNTPQ